MPLTPLFRPVQQCQRLTVMLFALSLAGCYDAAVLLKSREESRNLIQMEEVDLGSYRFTLPHKLGSSIDNSVDFHIFGKISRGDLQAINDALQMRGAELRSKLLVEVRAMPPATFEEPKLKTLREAIGKVINDAMERRVVKQIGFYRFSFNAM